jgi:hypothetical protein
MLFKIHRYLLVQHSAVLRDMLELPQAEENGHDPDHEPIILSGDKAGHWELVLSAFYRRYVYKLHNGGQLTDSNA